MVTGRDRGLVSMGTTASCVERISVFQRSENHYYRVASSDSHEAWTGAASSDQAVGANESNPRTF